MDEYFSMRVSMRKVGIFMIGLPLFATIFCVTWSLVFNFRESTSTECRVANYLPSISAAIGEIAPQKYVWRICIALHCLPRFVTALMYYHFHTSLPIATINGAYRTLAALCSLLHIAENFALVGLTYISSTENYSIHENSFITFMVTSLFYMLATCLIFYWGRSYKGRIKTALERKSLKYKVYLFIFNITVFLISVYMFYRHNGYCEPGVYTLFALGEYLVVFSNIAYHGTVIWDFHDVYVVFMKIEGRTYVPV